VILAWGPRLASWLLLIATLLGLSSSAYGHALQPGFLQIERQTGDNYSVLWKIPAVSGKAMDIQAILPAQCDQRTAAQSVWDGLAFLARWATRCAGGLEGGTVQIEGLDQTATDVLLRFDYSDGSTESRRLTPGDASYTIATIPGSFDVVKTYLVLGFEHILSGIDHLMFVLALLLLVKGKRRLIITVTAFTLAHSITLAGATLGWLYLPGPPIEATIALSIMFVASEIMHSRRGRIGLTERYPWVVAFTFGLLHGFGFAGALAQIGLPQASIPIALLFFNVGVELGQLFFIMSVFLIIAAIHRLMAYRHIDITEWVSNIPVYIIGSAAAFWIFQRLAAF